MAKSKSKPKAAPARKVGVGSTPPKNEATPLGTTTKSAKVHERTIKPSEADRMEKSRRLAAAYLEQRDGMDPQLALDVVESMDPDSINELITEANTTTIEQTKASQASVNATTGQERGAALVPEPSEPPPPSFTEIPALVSFEHTVASDQGETVLSFPELVIVCIEASRRKNEAEKEYKSTKAIVIGAMKSAGAELVECMDNRLKVYQGNTPRQLDEIMLLEKGVDPDIIAKCWKSTTYDDVRITVPKMPKEDK